jgi:signal transduction histidine kinase
MPLHRFDALPIRRKLLAMVLLPLLGVLPLLGLLLAWWSSAAFDRLLITKIRSDLAVAHGYFERVLGEVGAGTAAIAGSQALHEAMQKSLAPSGDDAIVRLLQQARRSAGLDFINLRRPDGRLRATDSGPADRADHRESPALHAALNGGDRTSIERLRPDQLDLLGPALRSRVDVPLLATRSAAPTTRTQEDRALVLLSTQAVRGSDGRLLGHVQGGVLLNRNLPFIDHINAIVYPEGSLPFGSRGTATLFLDDVRVSTNVRLFGATQDERAIGTRVSMAVRDAVLGRGQTWLDRAFVVNEWYVSAYQPLLDGRGERVGMLYVGFLERPFTLLKYGALASIGVIFFAVMIIAAVVSLRWARSIFAPLERMESTMLRVEGGHPGARVGAVAADDEIGRLARHFDHLLDTIDDKTAALQRWNAELDAKVAERTHELQTAQSQLLRSEKLAAVGQLTASIAHEVNNPIAVIQGNLDLLRTQLPPDAAGVVATEVRLIDEQVDRMRLIVTQLLQFARPTEYAGYVTSVDTARVVDDCLVLVGHQLARTRIEVRRELAATRQPAINRNELQQVLVNLLVNALHAMPDGGTLSIATRDLDADRITIDVADTGPGLEPALIDQLFKPFVTRKKDGTGLGLWISRSIVERYGGDLQAANRPHGGAVFSVVLHVDGAPPEPGATTAARAGHDPG